MKLRWAAVVLGAGLAAGACSGGTPGTDSGAPDASDVVSGGDASDGGMTDVQATPQCRNVGGAACFELPTAPVSVLVGDAGGSPDFSCAVVPAAQSTMPIMVNGTVSDFESGNRLAGATVSVFRDDDFTATPLAMATADTMGAFAFTLPTGTPNIVNWRTTSSGGLDTYVLADRIDVSMATLNAARDSVARSTAGGLAALIGQVRRMGTGVVASEAIDCRGRSLTDAVVTLSSTSSLSSGAAPTFVAGAQAYYFSVAPDLPTSRIERTTTNTNGLFLLIQVPPSTGTDRYYTQVWGFRTMGDVARGMAGLTLLAETPLRVQPDVVLIPTMLPRMLP